VSGASGEALAQGSARPDREPLERSATRVGQDGAAAERFTPWTPLFNLTGQPAIAIPAGIGSDGLPLSVQLVGRPGAEDVLYALAAQIEAEQPWAHRRPAVS